MKKVSNLEGLRLLTLLFLSASDLGWPGLVRVIILTGWYSIVHVGSDQIQSGSGMQYSTIHSNVRSGMSSDGYQIGGLGSTGFGTVVNREGMSERLPIIQFIHSSSPYLLLH